MTRMYLLIQHLLESFDKSYCQTRHDRNCVYFQKDKHFLIRYEKSRVMFLSFLVSRKHLIKLKKKGFF